MSESISDEQSVLITAALRRRVWWLLAAHLPAALLMLVAWWLALGWILVLHAIVLWGTLNPQSALFGPVLRSGSNSGRFVWVTIDDGPSFDTLAILQLLQEYDIKATFFLVADRALRQPELVRAIITAGHEVGNHSATHPASRFWSLSPRRMTEQIVVAQRNLTELSGAPVRWFRAVVGHANPFVDPVLRVLGLRRVAWNVRAFVLLHEGAAHGQSLVILRIFLQGLHERGYRAVLPH
jgi:peptidoglycan-N-acetylglucosamine deacetylase